MGDEKLPDPRTTEAFWKQHILSFKDVILASCTQVEIDPTHKDKFEILNKAFHNEDVKTVLEVQVGYANQRPIILYRIDGLHKKHVIMAFQSRQQSNIVSIPCKGQDVFYKGVDHAAQVFAGMYNQRDVEAELLDGLEIAPVTAKIKRP